MGKLIRNRIEYTGGGGGSGGHTIVDDTGTDLAQRTNLQFKGAYTEDNSTDNTTEVNVVREMTKAEFDLLSTDEKVGFINITDITGGNDDRFQPVVYSEEEREIGVWTDGKPLYEKTINIAQYSVTATDTAWTNLFAVSNIEYLVGAESHGNAPNIGQILRFQANNGYIQIASKTNINVSVLGTFYFTFRYTKTTDTAGSGQWTPQGVPAVHYSTDEQVVGTWIDGSTIFEKTVDVGTLPNTATKTVAHNISNLDKVLQISGAARNSSNVTLPLPSPDGVLEYTINVSTNSTNITIQTYRDRSGFSGYLTIRYTKSS